jgi:hypothetical protein
MTDKLFTQSDYNIFIAEQFTAKQISKSLASNLKTAMKSIVKYVFIDDMGINDINIKEIIGRYKDLAKGKMTDNTIAFYSVKFSKGMKLYLEYCKNADKNIKVKKKTIDKSKQIVMESVVPTQLIEVMKQPAKTCVFPIPLRPNLIVELSNLPHDLTAKEAAKICAVVKALSE